MTGGPAGQDSMRAPVLRNGQETTSKLSQVANDVSKMSLAMQELQKRQDFHAKKLGAYASAWCDLAPVWRCARWYSVLMCPCVCVRA